MHRRRNGHGLNAALLQHFLNFRPVVLRFDQIDLVEGHDLQLVGQAMPEHLVLVLAQRGSRPIAASLLVRDHDRLYGRYWGALEHVPCLHFEAAYYQAIEAAIEGGIALVEGGAQGEHKMARGFLPVPTCSAHWLAHPAFADAVDRFLRNEDRMIGAYMDELDERTPFARERDDAGDR